MRKMFKKALAAAMGLFLLMSMMPSAVFAAVAAETDGTSPTVESLVIQPMTIVEHCKGSWVYDDKVYYHYSPGAYMEYTVVWADGTEKSGTGQWIYYGENEYCIDWTTDQSCWEPWLPGNTYTMTATLLNKTVEVPVTIVEKPIASFTVEPISVVAETNGWFDQGYNPETDEWDREYFYYDTEDMLNYTIVWKDGTETSGSGPWVEYNGKEYRFDCSTEQSYSEQWLPGNTYTMTVRLMGVEVEVPVTIEECPIVSFTVEPISTIVETNGWFDVDYNPETDEWDREYYRYDAYDMLNYTIVWKDGTETSGSDPWVEYNGYEYDISCLTGQSYETPWLPGNTYTMTVRLMGVEVEVPVTIECPIVSFTAEPVSVFAETNGYWTTDYNPETGNYDLEYYYYQTRSFLTYTIVWKDGTVTTKSNTYVTYQGNDYYISTYSGQSYETPWLPGNTYTVTLSLMGVEVEVPVTVEAPPVKSLAVKPVTLLPESSGWWPTEYNPNTGKSEYQNYFNYYPASEYTITWSDGSKTTTDEAMVEYKGHSFEISLLSDQSKQNPWLPGNTYTATASIAGMKAEYDVTIAQTPVASLTVDPIVIPVETGGYWASQYDEATGTQKKYYLYRLQSLLTSHITWKDGTKVNVCGSKLDYDGGKSMRISDGQSYETPWLPGNTYTATVRLMGVEVEVPVTIEMPELASIEVKPLTVTEGVNGGWITDVNEETQEKETYFHYSLYSLENALEYTVTWKDGTKTSGSGAKVSYKKTAAKPLEFKAQDNQSYDNPWLPGNTYTVTVSLLGKSVEVPVTVEASPIASLEVKPVTVMERTSGYVWYAWNPETNAYDREVYHYQPESVMEYTVTWKDGTKTSGIGNTVEYNGKTYYMGYQTGTQNADNPWLPGNTYTMTVTLMGKSVEVPVTVKAAAVQSLEVAPITVTAETFGEWVQKAWNGPNDPAFPPGYYQYDISDLLSYTVTWKDGTKTSGKGSEVDCNGVRCRLETVLDQSAYNPWLPGNTYTATVRLMGVEAEVPVTIAKSTAVRSITVEPLTVYRDQHSQKQSTMIPDESGYAEFDWYDYADQLRITVEWQDNTRQTFVGTDAITYQGNTYQVSLVDKQSPANFWLPDETYNVEVRLLGVSAIAQVSVKASANGDDEEDKPTVLPGDVNGDGQVNIVDAFAVYRAASKGEMISEVADMNGDGKINLTDAFAVYRIASGK